MFTPANGGAVTRDRWPRAGARLRPSPTMPAPGRPAPRVRPDASVAVLPLASPAERQYRWTYQRRL